MCACTVSYWWTVSHNCIDLLWRHAAVAIDKETTAEHDQDNMVSRQEDNDAMSPDTEADKQEDMLGGITAEADNLDDIADDDDDEAILMKDNELDDALNDFDYANLSNNMDSYGEDEEENLAGEDNLELGDIQAESKLRDAMGQYRSALSRYTESVKAVKSKSSHNRFTILWRSRSWEVEIQSATRWTPS